MAIRVIPKQDLPLIYEPALGGLINTTITANEYREYYPTRGWVFDPWTGNARASTDMLQDLIGVYIIPTVPAVD